MVDALHGALPTGLDIQVQHDGMSFDAPLLRQAQEVSSLACST